MEKQEGVDWDEPLIVSDCKLALGFLPAFYGWFPLNKSLTLSRRLHLDSIVSKEAQPNEICFYDKPNTVHQEVQVLLTESRDEHMTEDLINSRPTWNADPGLYRSDLTKNLKQHSTVSRSACIGGCSRQNTILSNRGRTLRLCLMQKSSSSSWRRRWEVPVGTDNLLFPCLSEQSRICDTKQSRTSQPRLEWNLYPSARATQRQMRKDAKWERGGRGEECGEEAEINKALKINSRGQEDSSCLVVAAPSRRRSSKQQQHWVHDVSSFLSNLL